MKQLSIDIGAKAFPLAGQQGRRIVLSNFEMAVDAGSFLCILGPSGCGKTTLLNIVAGLDRDFEGKVSWPKAADAGAVRLGYVFQNPTLLPWRNVTENIQIVMTHENNARGLDRELLERMGLYAYRDSFPKDLSLGMSRRVSLARAFAVEPDLLLMDEPFVSLDEETSQSLRLLLLEIWRSKPVTVLFVTHDSREAIQLGQRIVALSGSPARIHQDLAVHLTTEERDDPAKVELLREELKVSVAVSKQTV